VTLTYHVGEVSDLPAAGLFSFIGYEPATEWIREWVRTDNKGFIRTDRDLAPDDLGEGWIPLGRTPLPYESSRPGLFAVGDVRSGSLKRVAAAVGEGTAAVRSVHDHLAFRA
jgi:thioredoxin reductase (NADPH)